VCAREETRDFGMFFHSFEDWVTGADVCRTCRTHSPTHSLHSKSWNTICTLKRYAVIL
jgi:hypothetical protein